MLNLHALGEALAGFVLLSSKFVGSVNVGRLDAITPTKVDGVEQAAGNLDALIEGFEKTLLPLHSPGPIESALPVFKQFVYLKDLAGGCGVLFAGRF